MTKSPFLVFPEFISPLMCEELVDDMGFSVPDVDADMNPVLTKKTADHLDKLLYPRINSLIPTLEQHYTGFVYKGMERVTMEWIPESAQIDPACEAYEFLRKQWVQVRPRDLTAILFCTDYQDQPHFDREFEVYGGKVEFPQHAFGFNPQRGTLVVFPSGPHFINNTTNVMVGNAFQARIQLASQMPLIYDPRQYPGNYTTWFK